MTAPCLVCSHPQLSDIDEAIRMGAMPDAVADDWDLTIAAVRVHTKHLDQPTPENPLLAAALGYVDRGWKVMPLHSIVRGEGCSCMEGINCRSAGKHPRTVHGLKDATLDKDLVRDWWRKWPDANVGIATGAGSGVWVLDVDQKKDGVLTLAALEKQHGPLSRVIACRTGGGGWHIYFAWPADRGVRTTVGVFPGIDTRGDGGLVVAPPSRHLSGEFYRWEGDGTPEAASEWLMALLDPAVEPPTPASVPAGDATTPAERLVAWAVKRVQDGHGRNETGFALACQCRDNRIAPEAATDIMAAYVAAVTGDGDHPYSAKEAGKSLSQAYRRPARDPWATQPTSASVDDLGDWQQHLLWIKDSKGFLKTLIPGIHNAAVILGLSPELRGCVYLDEFASRIMIDVEPPWGGGGSRPWKDVDYASANAWLQARHKLNVGIEPTRHAVEVVGSKDMRHPVREYLLSLEWDGEVRTDNWLHEFCGVRESHWASIVGPRWLISAVARVMSPGCKADHTLILEGAQRIGKSSALATLAHPWFTDELGDLGSKDAAQQLHGVWVVELAELDAIGRAEVSRTKAFLSKTFDRFRPAYGVQVRKVPRQNVFAGTVNQSEYLRDDTGNRRFWPVKCGKVDLELLESQRDQLWAEALVRYTQGEVWWLGDRESALAEEETERRMEVDAWEETIRSFVASRKDARLVGVTLSDIMGALGIEIARRTRTDQFRVTRALTRMGWARTEGRGRDGERILTYRPSAKSLRLALAEEEDDGLGIDGASDDASEPCAIGENEGRR